jgi:hypothetical protein
LQAVVSWSREQKAVSWRSEQLVGGVIDGLLVEFQGSRVTDQEMARKHDFNC